MSYVFLVLAHGEAIAGFVALAAVLIFLLGADGNKKAFIARCIWALAALALYYLVKNLIGGTAEFLMAASRAQWSWLLILYFLMSMAAGVVLAVSVVRALESEFARRFACACCAFAVVGFGDGYTGLLLAGTADHLLALSVLVLFTGSAATAVLLLLYKPSG